jgi:hypothetical protein
MELGLLAESIELRPVRDRLPQRVHGAQGLSGLAGVPEADRLLVERLGLAPVGGLAAQGLQGHDVERELLRDVVDVEELLEADHTRIHAPLLHLPQRGEGDHVAEGAGALLGLAQRDLQLLPPAAKELGEIAGRTDGHTRHGFDSSAQRA